MALNLSKFTPARKIYTDGVGRVGDNYLVCHGGDGEKMILLMLMMVMNTWTTRVNGTSCTYDDDDEGDIYCGVFEKMMIQMMRVMEMNTTHGRMGPVAHQLNRIAAHNVMHQIQMVLDRIICITSKQA